MWSPSYMSVLFLNSLSVLSHQRPAAWDSPLSWRADGVVGPVLSLLSTGPQFLQPPCGQLTVLSSASCQSEPCLSSPPQ
jgi:hypothetical protein